MIWIFVNVFLRDWRRVFAHPHFLNMTLLLLLFRDRS